MRLFCNRLIITLRSESLHHDKIILPVRGHIADNFWNFEEVSDVSRVQEGYVAAGLHASGTYMVEQAGDARPPSLQQRPAVQDEWLSHDSTRCPHSARAIIDWQVPEGGSKTMPRAILESDHQPPVLTTVRSDAATPPGTTVQTVLRALARALTSAIYISAGYEVVRMPGGRVSKASDTLAKIRRVMPLPVEDEFIVRANGAVQVAAGTALALGIKPRLSAAVLAGSLLPTTIAGHAFWTIDDASERQTQQLQFLKNLSMLGGLLFAVVDSPRSPP